jgi:hypothetical protein
MQLQKQAEKERKAQEKAEQERKQQLEKEKQAQAKAEKERLKHLKVSGRVIGQVDLRRGNDLVVVLTKETRLPASTLTAIRSGLRPTVELNGKRQKIAAGKVESTQSPREPAPRSDVSFELRDVPPGAYVAVAVKTTICPAPAPNWSVGIGSAPVVVTDQDIVGLVVTIVPQTRDRGSPSCIIPTPPGG